MSNMSPVVGISKIISQYQTIVVGFDGVLYDGKEINLSAVKTLAEIKKRNKNIILLSNTPMRIKDIIRILHTHNVPLNIFSLIMTAGELLHFMLKLKIGDFGKLGSKYFCLGERNIENIMQGLDFEKVEDINKADFVFVGGLKNEDDKIENYREIIEIAVSLNMPLACAGNDVYTHINGKVCPSGGAFAEQYAMTGGHIITCGKPDLSILKYVLESVPTEKDKLLIIGDSLPTDIKMANLYNSDSVLITRGSYKEFLGEGYIPDLQKAKDLAADYGVFPQYLMAELRW